MAAVGLVDRKRGGGGKNGVAVRRRAADGSCGEVAAGAAAIFHHHRLPEALAELLSNQAGDDVGDHALREASRAWHDIKIGWKRQWSDWTTVIGPGLMKARAEAMAVARTNRPEGRGYSTAMGKLLAEYKLDDMSKATRSAILNVMEHLQDVEAWRVRQPKPEELNNPTVVWLKFKRSGGYQAEHPRPPPRPSKMHVEVALDVVLEHLHGLDPDERASVWQRLTGPFGMFVLPEPRTSTPKPARKKRGKAKASKAEASLTETAAEGINRILRNL
jgi:hypothetical protein